MFFVVNFAFDFVKDCRAIKYRVESLEKWKGEMEEWNGGVERNGGDAFK